jgi:hypothetical protein
MFIPRHPVIEDQFCSYATQSGTAAQGVGGVIAYAGTVVYLDPGAANQEAMVRKMVYNAGTSFTSFGFLMQKIKTGYHQVHPAGYYMPGDLGSSDAIAQPSYNNNGTIIGTKAVPAGVSHLGIWDTVHYTCTKTYDGTNSDITTAMLPGAHLYAAADEGKVTNSTAAADGDDTANTGDVDTGDQCSSTSTATSAVAVAVVVKGASTAKCQANIDNTTLYPIRIKLLV